MAFDQDALSQSLHRLGKSLKRVRRSAEPEDVHQLRTRSRRLEAAIHALGLEGDPSVRRLLKIVTPLRRKAGKVRDMDVLLGLASRLARAGDDDALVQLLEGLAERRRKAARKLQSSVAEEIKPARRLLKRGHPLFQADADAFAEQQSKALSAALCLSAELESWPRLTRANLHRYRLKVKKLPYTAEIVEDARPGFIGSLIRVTDAIGEWHDWSELHSIATGILKDRQRSGVLRAIRSTAAERLREALVVAGAMQGQYRLGLSHLSPKPSPSSKPDRGRARGHPPISRADARRHPPAAAPPSAPANP
jgi:CHAD domain-containing protein